MKLYDFIRAVHLIMPHKTINQRLLDQLKFNFSQLQLKDIDKCSPSEALWLRVQHQLKDHVINNNLLRFLQWPVIQQSMCVADAPYTETELNFLKLNEWKKWSVALRDEKVGHPFPYWKRPSLKTDANTIHLTYHLSQFESLTGKKVTEHDIIFEFGGGYGCMRRVIHNMGYQGRYIIFDLEPLSYIQEFYLAANRIKNTECIHSLNALEASMDSASGRCMFIATWSLSETPLAFRKTLLEQINGHYSYLIAFQDNFCEINNMPYFEQFRKLNKNKWYERKILFLPNSNRYIFS